MIASLLGDVAQLILAVATLVTALIAWSGRRISQQVRTEVKTMNGLTMAQMADAGETRRVDAIATEDRTTAEQRHVDAEPRTEDRP